MNTNSHDCAVFVDELERGIIEIKTIFSEGDERGAVEIEAVLAKADRLAQWALAISSETDIEHGEDLLSSIIAVRDAVLDCLQEADRGRGRPMIPILRYLKKKKKVTGYSVGSLRSFKPTDI